MPRSLFLTYIIPAFVACCSQVAAFEQAAQPDPKCDKLCTGHWWEKTPNRIMKLDVPREDVVAFALYTHDHGVLKLTTQLFPLYSDESLEVRLELKRGDEWQQVAAQKVNPLRLEYSVSY